MKPATSLLMLLLACGLSACVSNPRYARAVPAQEAPPPVIEVYFAPLQGQDPVQQDRDRYECYLWAKNQTGFDPSYPYLAPHQRTVVIPEPAPGTNTVVGAITGAVIGAVLGGSHHGGEGALIGAFAGGALGAASDAGRQEQAARLEEHYARQSQGQRAELDRQAASYRRAMKACLEGRGYSVH